MPPLLENQAEEFVSRSRKSNYQPSTFMRILKCTAIIFVILVLTWAALFYAFIHSKELHRIIFPLEYRTSAYSIKCRDLVISSTDTMRLNDIEVEGAGFSLVIPCLETRYSLFPPAFSNFTAKNPYLKLRYGKTRGNTSLPNNMAMKVLEKLHVENGTFLYTQQNFSIRAEAIHLSPSKSRDTNGEIRLTQGKCNFHVVANREVIKGDASMQMSRRGKVRITAPDITVMLNRHPPFSISADIGTGVMPEDLGIIKGSIKVPDVLPLLPPVLKQSPYMRRRVLSSHSLPASASISMDFRQGTGIKGMIQLSPWLFPDKSAPAHPVPARWTLDISKDFRSGNFTGEADGIHTHVHGSFRIDDNNSVEWITTFNILLNNLAWNMDNNHAAEGINAVLDVTMDNKAGRNSRKPNNPLRWKVVFSMDHGYVLLYPWFIDFSSSENRLTAEGTAYAGLLKIDRARLSSFLSASADSITLDLGQLEEMKQGRIIKYIIDTVSDKGRIRLTGPLENTYNLLIRDPFSLSYPILKNLRPHGTFSTVISGTDADINIGMDLFWKDRHITHNLKLDILMPLAGEECNSGSISWDWIFVPVMHGLLPSGRASSAARPVTTLDSTSPHMNIDGFFMTRDRLPVMACRDRLVSGQINIPAGNGNITIKRGELDYARMNMQLTGINLTGIKLDRLVNGLPINAVVSAKDISVNFINGRLDVKGSISSRIAGGTVEHSGLWMDLSGPFPRYGAKKIVFKGLDLAELSRLTSFGRITGRVDGHINGLIISGTQPERFDLEIRNRKTPGVKQEISLKAVQNISILGGGPDSIPFLGTFFKNFSYSRIAVSCVLENDIFTMHGLIKKDGIEYLVERGFWGGVNVINQNPAGRIAFSDMLERLERISKPGKPRME